jgi:hypothetical protein
VRPTSLYDQLRGERINADIPEVTLTRNREITPENTASPLGRPGPTAEVSAQLGAVADRAADWSWFTMIEPVTRSVVNATSRAQPTGETPRHGPTHSAS